MDQPAASLDVAQINITKGHPTAEEVAALTALLMAMGNSKPVTPEVQSAPKRLSRLRRRRALTTPRLSWNLGRR